MGLSLLGALAALAFALLGQSPGLMNRLGVGGARLDLRVRTFTTYAFALILLSIGFFLAGVPMDSGGETKGGSDDAIGASAVGDVIPGSEAPSLDSLSRDESENSNQQETDEAEAEAANTTPETGSFSGPPPTPVDQPSGSDGEQSPDTLSPVETAVEASIPEPESTRTPRPTSTATATPSPSPTPTPSPTITPTPITGETAVVSSGGSTIWIVRSPGGQNVTLVRDGDTVLILPGHANQAGQLWREVRTVSGILGWIQEIFLEYE